MLPILLIVLLTIVVDKQCSCFDYCTVKCDSGPRSHTMCKYVRGGGDAACAKHQSLQSKSSVLSLQNKFRQRLANGKEKGQPPASNMMELEWDDELETIAQRWADQCQKYFQHDECRLSMSGELVGQNIGMIYEHSLTNSTNKVETMVKGWHDEGANREVPNMHDFNPDNFLSIGHYSQMVWAATRKVGCGYSGSSDIHTFVLVCNYKPAGNILTQPMYKVGPACSECPSDTSCSKEYPGLCKVDVPLAQRTAWSHKSAATLGAFGNFHPLIFVVIMLTLF